MCPHEEKLTAWLLGDLSPTEHQSMTSHLETCDSCRSVKEELSSVLTPLRSGLEKDGHLRLSPPFAKAPPRSTFRALWTSPHKELKRAAILTLTFGTLFGLMSVVYQNVQRSTHDPAAVTHITFARSAEEPVPSLTPVAKRSTEAADKELLVDSVPRSESSNPSTAVVMAPATPVPEPKAPAFRRLVTADAGHDAKQKQAGVASTATAAAPAPMRASLEKAIATKRERSKSASTPAKRTDPGLLVRDLKLTAPPPAPTNTAATNVPPASAVTNSPPPRK